jgi:hypothetical protein
MPASIWAQLSRGAENFRVQHKAPLNYSTEDLETDRERADRLLKRLRSPLLAKT